MAMLYPVEGPVQEIPDLNYDVIKDKVGEPFEFITLMSGDTLIVNTNDKSTENRIATSLANRSLKGNVILFEEGEL